MMDEKFFQDQRDELHHKYAEKLVPFSEWQCETIRFEGLVIDMSFLHRTTISKLKMTIIPSKR